ncbi:MAG: Gfo/Idh/MocA family protein [Christensenellales bacterium]
MGKLKFGMVGGGPGSFIADVHRRSALFDGLNELCAGCFSRDYDKTIATGRQLGITDESRLYASYEEMAKAEGAREDGIDFIIIAAPNNVHYPAAKAFLQNGIHVICDKPLTHTSEQGEALKQIAQEKNLLFCVTYVYTGYPAVEAIRKHIQDGDLGDILTVNVQYLQGYHAAAQQQDSSAWRFNPELVGSSFCLGDIGTHAENIAAYMTGLKIEEVYASMQPLSKITTLDTNSQVLLRYKGGATGLLWCSTVTLGHDNDLCVGIYGNKASIEWCQEDGEHYTIGRPDGTRTRITAQAEGLYARTAQSSRLPAGHPEGYYESFANIYTDFSKAIIAQQEGKPYAPAFPDIDLGIEGVKFVEACVKSHESKQWEKL